MNTQQVSDLRLLYHAVYDENLREQAEEYNNTVFDEDIVEVATEYFYTYGLNEDGIDILIEKVGLDNFVEFVYSLSEDLTVLTEARAAKKRTGGKSYEEVKAEIDRKEAAKKAAKKKASEAAQERTETEKKEPESKGADTEAKAQQPKKRPIRDAIARQVLAGMKAMELARETGKTVAKAAAVTHEAGRRAGEHVKKYGLKSLANEEFEGDIFDVILEHLVAEGYADTNQAALAIMANMSEEWKDQILDEAQIMSVSGKGGLIYMINPKILRAQNAAAKEAQGRKSKEKEAKNKANAARYDKTVKKSIQTLNAKPGADSGDYDSGHHGDDDTSNGSRHYSLSRTNRSARKRRESGR